MPGLGLGRVFGPVSLDEHHLMWIIWRRTGAPLEAISGARFKPATILVNGHRTLGLGGEEAADVGIRAPSSPDSVMVRRKHNRAFEELYARLLDVVERNAADTTFPEG